VLGAQAAGAQVHLFGLTIDGDGHWVDVGYPLAVGMPFRVAHVMTELGRFATDIALQVFSPLTNGLI
jgi:hypothetical protein